MLTSAQQLALRTMIKADANISASYVARDVNALCAYLATDSTFVVYRNTTATSDIYDAIAWANLTPTDVPDGTAGWTNRALMCQCKQMNLQLMLQGKDWVNTGKANFRAGLSDALLNIPSGAAGVLVSGGWLAVKPVICRPATLYEKIFATGTGTSATPGSLVIEGDPSLVDVATSLYNLDGSPK